MKYALAALVLGLVVAMVRPGPAPQIERQHSEMVTHAAASPTWERHIVIRNVRREAVWVYVECESRLISTAIGLLGHRMAEVTFPDIPPAESCLIDHWIVQEPGVYPPEWRP